MKKTAILGQLAILLSAFLLRTWRLLDIPPGILRDETLNTDVARFIRMGQHALFFREGYGHEPLYHYLTVPFAPLLGENVLSTRLPAVFLGLLLIAAVMRWVRRDFGVAAALLSGALLSVSWWALIFSRIGLRPILEPLFIVAAVYWWRKRPWWAGVCLALAIYSYTAARVIWLWPLLVLAWLVIRHGWSKRSWSELPKIAEVKQTAIVFLTSFTLYLPLAYVLWRDPSLQERVNQLSGPLEALQQGDFMPIWLNLWRTLGVFSVTGDPLWSYAMPHQPLFDPLVSIFFYLGGALVLWRFLKGRFTAALLCGWFAVAIAPSALAPDAPSLVRLIGLLPLAYLLVALGVVSAGSFVAQRFRQRPTMLIVPAAVLVVAFTGWRTVDTGRAWLAAPEVREKYQSIWLDIARYWRDSPTEVVIADSWYEPVKADSLRLDVGSTLPARWVQNHRALVLPAADSLFYVPEFAPPHPLLFELITAEPLYRSAAYPSFAVYPLPAELPIRRIEPLEMAHPGGGRVSLLGYQFVSAESELHLLSYWRVEQPLPWDTSSFLHALGADGQVVAQYDGLDAAASTLQTGDRFVQLHTLPANLEATKLVLGMYTRDSGVRFQQIDTVLDFIELDAE